MLYSRPQVGVSRHATFFTTQAATSLVSVPSLGELCWSLFLAAPPDRPAQPAPPPHRVEAESRPGPRLDPALEAALDAELAAELG